MLPALLAIVLSLLPVVRAHPAAGLMHVPTHRRAVALTVNDGPDGRVTPMMLRLLRERGASATFFVNGDALRDEPQMLLEIRAAGCEIANHGFHHRRLAGRPYQEIASEVRRTAKLISELVPISGPYLRPPYGSVDRGVVRAARNAHLRIVLWNVGDTDEALRKLPAKLHPGDIVSVRDDEEGYKELRAVLDLVQREHLQANSLGVLLAQR